MSDALMRRVVEAAIEWKAHDAEGLTGNPEHPANRLCAAVEALEHGIEDGLVGDDAPRLPDDETIELMLQRLDAIDVKRLWVLVQTRDSLREMDAEISALREQISRLGKRTP